MIPKMSGLAVRLVGWGDENLPAFDHRFAASHGEIDKSLLDLAAVGLHSPQAFRGIDFQDDFFAMKPVEHFHQLLEKFAELQGSLARGRGLAECEQLVGERRGAHGRFLNLA